jgi:hypothetical protein
MASTQYAGLTATVLNGCHSQATAAAVRSANSGLTVTPKVNFTAHIQGAAVNFLEGQVAVVTAAELAALNALTNHASLFVTP